MKKKIKPPTEAEYQRALLQTALDCAPRIYACKKCGWPVASGYVCNYCGDDEPYKSAD